MVTLMTLVVMLLVLVWLTLLTMTWSSHAPCAPGRLGPPYNWSPPPYNHLGWGGALLLCYWNQWNPVIWWRSLIICLGNPVIWSRNLIKLCSGKALSNFLNLTWENIFWSCYLNIDYFISWLSQRLASVASVCFELIIQQISFKR